MGTLHVPARCRERRMVVGDRRAEAAPRARLPRRISATTRRASSRPSARSAPRSNASSSSEGNGEGRRITHLNDGDSRPPHRGDLLRRAGAGAEPMPTAPIRPSPRCSSRPRSAPTTASSSRAGARARPERTGHRACAFRRGQLRLAARHRGRDRPPRLHRPRPHRSPMRRPSSRGARLAGQRRLRARSGRCRCAARSACRPARRSSLTFWTVVGKARAEVEETMSPGCDHPESFARQTMLSWTRSQVQTRHVGLTLAEAANVQQLARYLLYPDAVMRAAGAGDRSRPRPQSALWPTGDFRRLPDLRAADRRRRRPGDRRVRRCACRNICAPAA